MYERRKNAYVCRVINIDRLTEGPSSERGAGLKKCVVTFLFRRYFFQEKNQKQLSYPSRPPARTPPMTTQKSTEECEREWLATQQQKAQDWADLERVGAHATAADYWEYCADKSVL